MRTWNKREPQQYWKSEYDVPAPHGREGHSDPVLTRRAVLMWTANSSLPPVEEIWNRGREVFLRNVGPTDPGVQLIPWSSVEWGDSLFRFQILIHVSLGHETVTKNMWHFRAQYWQQVNIRVWMYWRPRSGGLTITMWRRELGRTTPYCECNSRLWWSAVKIAFRIPTLISGH